MDKRNPWFSNELFNARRLNEAADELSRLHESNATTEQQVLHLLKLDRDQGHEIAKLQAAVWILMQMLAETGAVDGPTLDKRLHDAFESLSADPSWQRMRGL